MSHRDFHSVKTAIQPDPAVSAHQRSALFAVVSAIGDNDLESLHQHFTEDAELHIAGFPGIDGSWKGRDQVIAAIGVNFGKLVEQKPEVDAIIHEGDAIAMLLRETGRFKADGSRYEARGVIWCTFRDLQLRRVEEILNVTLFR